MANSSGRTPKIKKFEFKFKINLKNLLLWGLIVWLGISFFVSLRMQLPGKEKIPLSQVLTDIKEGKIEKIEVEDSRLYLTYKDGQISFSQKEPGVSFTETLKSADISPQEVNLVIRDLPISGALLDIISTVIPVALMIFFFVYLFRQAKGAQESIFSFGKSTARIFAKGKQIVTFKDVAGVDEAKKELQEVVDFLKHPEKYRKLGARTPKGVILIGPSGTGKTLLAKAVAGEANVPFFSAAGSEFMEMLVGVGPARIRDLFAQAKKAAPSIIFIDEIDAIGRQRGLGITAGHDEREQTLNQILVEMDGFTPNDNVIVLAASVVGETPILIKKGEKIKLISIGEVIDQYFSGEEEGEKELKEEIFCLGFERKISKGNLTKNNLYFGGSGFKRIRSVFRHKVKEIYEITYLGGKIRATGSHSVFIRSRKGIEVKAVASLKKGDVLVDLPFKVNRTKKEKMEIRAHQFGKDWSLSLLVFDPYEEEKWEERYLFATQNPQGLSQAQIGQILGVSQGTVSHWQRGISTPRQISKKYFKHQLPQEVKVTPQLCRLMGYYVAEGYSRWELDFCFSIKESEKIQDLVNLMEEVFGLKPDYIRHITPGAVNIVYSAAPLARFFARWCGRGAKNKHLPSFLFEAPWEYFKEFLKGVWAGDGYEDKRRRGEITSVSKQLILELNWLCRMHGIKTYINKFVAKEGRRVKNGKPLAETLAYRLGWGKTNNPFNYYPSSKTYPVKRAIVREVKKIPFNGFVYDLCGVENEAFFGGESPVLLHNTNRGDLLDPALMRPGRFDRRVVLDLPDLEDRKAILAIHARGKPFEKDVKWEEIARSTVGFSGADLENMLNEAAILAARENRKAITLKDINEAGLKVKLGPEKKRLQTDEERKMTAYHEAGHAVVSYHLPHMDPVQRVSIISRGLAMGFTLIPPTKERYTETKSHLEETIASLLGGRAAEELVFKEFTAGAASDIDRATRIARSMVIDFGMSRLGPVYLGPQMEETEWGKSWWQPTEISPKMAARVDEEIKRIVDEGYKRALGILKVNRRKLDLIAHSLLEKETIEGEEFQKLMKERK